MRLFVCDPTCAIPYGHTVTALKYFQIAFRDQFSKIFSLCGIDLDAGLAEHYGFQKHYRFYYSDYIKIPGQQRSAIEGNSATAYVDRLEAIATDDAASMLQKYAIGEDDTIFFPGLDFYGVIGLLNALSKRETGRMPRILLRFIGVMENATHTYRCPLHELVSRIKESEQWGVRFAFSAETPRYADELARLLDTTVVVTPYPFVGSQLDLPPTGPTQVYCPGSARVDKGFFNLFDIFSRVRSRDPRSKIKFTTQILPDSEAKQAEKYLSQLYAIPGVTLLPAVISEEDMVRSYRNSHIILLPYDPATYEFRGSAVMMEAAYFGRPVVMLDGPAFADQVRYFGLGYVESDVPGIVDRILDISGQPRAKLKATVRQARSRFVADAAGAYETWMRTHT